MKTLTNYKITVTGDKLTLTADIVEQQFNQILTSRVSHGHLNPDHQHHHRHIQSSSEAIFVKHMGHGFALSNDFVAALASVVEPRTAFAPIFKHSSTPNKVEVVSESPVALQWQTAPAEHFIESPTPHTAPTPVTWVDIAGETGDSIDESKVEKGHWVRCKAVNATGETTSRAVQRK